MYRHGARGRKSPGRGYRCRLCRPKSSISPPLRFCECIGFRFFPRRPRWQVVSRPPPPVSSRHPHPNPSPASGRGAFIVSAELPGPSPALAGEGLGWGWENNDLPAKPAPNTRMPKDSQALRMETFARVRISSLRGGGADAAIQNPRRQSGLPRRPHPEPVEGRTSQ